MTTENNLPTEDPQDTPPADPPVEDTPPADDAPADPPADDTPPDDDGGDDDHRGSRSQERIRELIAERKALEEYATYWRNKALEPAQQQHPAQEPADKPAPKLEDFDSTEKWAAAYQQWTEDRIEKRAEEAAQRITKQRQEEAERASSQAKWQDRLDKFLEQHPDAQRVIANPTLPITKAMAEVITASENGPALAYHLGKNPVEAARIARMSPTQQAAALGRLEAKLASAPAPRPRPQVSRAPAPPAPIDGAGTPSVDLENCSLSEFLERRLGKRKRA